MNLQKKLVPFIVFFIVANPATYKLTGSILGKSIASPEGLPTTMGLLLHALVFVIVAHFLWKFMYRKKKSYYGSMMGKSYYDGVDLPHTGSRGDRGAFMAADLDDPAPSCK